MTDVLAAFTLHPPEGPAFELLVVFLCVVLGPPLVQKAKVPGIIGLLLGGFLIGPNGLELIPAGSVLVPELGKVGLLYLMFVAGVELDLALLRVHRRAALVFGLMTFLAPMFMGTAVGLLLDFGAAGSLLLGSLLASHTLVLYPLVRERGLASDPAMASAVGATVLTDTLALVVLAGVAGSETQGGGVGSIALQIGGGLAILLVATLLLLPLAARATFGTLGRSRPIRYLLVFSFFLAAAVLADVVGIEGIVGAFFAGLALNRFVPNRGPLMSRIDFFGTALFIPMFLVSVGLLLDPEVMTQGETLKYAGIFVAACLGGKAIAAALTGPLFGYTRSQAALIFALTIPQAAATLAATIVGFDIGLFSETVVNAVLVLILVSVVVSTLVGERVADGMTAVDAGTVPLGEHVLVVVDEGLAPDLACHAAAHIAEADGGIVLPVLLLRSRRGAADAVRLRALEDAVQVAGIDADPTVIVATRPAEAILDLAAAQGASLVLVVQGHDQADPSFGSWSEAVAGLCPAPVAMVRGGYGGFRRTHIGADPRVDPAAPAVALAREIATRLGATDLHARPLDENAQGLTVVPVESWGELDALATPADGGLLLVPAPTVSRPTVPDRPEPPPEEQR